MITMLKNTLDQIGLSKNEQRVFVALLQYPGLRATELAAKTHLNRTTGYGILESLIEKGLVSSIEKKGVQEFHAIEPTLLVDYLERKTHTLSQSIVAIKKSLPILEKMRSKKHSYPKIQFFEGKEGVKQAYEDTLENNRGKELLDFTGADAVYAIMGEEWAHYYTHKRKRLGIRCVAIAPDSLWTRKSKTLDKSVNRTTKILPQEYEFETEIDLYDDKVGIFSFSEESPLAIIIEDEKISHTMKQLFRYIEKSIDSESLPKNGVARSK